ncbi:MAG: von Willebrand factor type [Actinomycetia bacterium]|nr:von Willebrand factor type [Actinomycetes bacterium]
MAQVLPFYLVCDESGSMAGEPLDAINASLPEIHSEIGSSPVVADKTKFALIGFSDYAEVVLELSDLSMITYIPGLTVKGGTNYSSAFDLLYDTISEDVQKLKGQGDQVYRPAVFFLSDGQPGDQWEGSYKRLTDPNWSYHPNILAFGFGTVDPTTLQQVATVRAFIADGTMGPAQALREFAQSLIQSIVSSGSKPAENGALTLAVPDQVPGFTALPADEI